MRTIALCIMIGTIGFASANDLRVPPEFVVEQFASAEHANDVSSLHIDSAGRIVVAGPGYVRYLVGESKTERAIDLVRGNKEVPMGLLWEGETLYVVADGGLRKFVGVTGAQPITTSELVVPGKTGGEHGAHAIRRGPDGALYWLCGNNTNITAKSVTDPDSIIKNPIAGVFVRINAKNQVAVLADGFRNPYDFDFDRNGVPHTFDSDNERCVGLPWYEFTRFYRIVPGGNYGWLNPQHTVTWRQPPYFPDVEAPITTLGRGSPTGCVCYRHTQFPPGYRDGFFLADWTFGRIWFVRGGTKSVFVEPTGTNGFAPTALAVHPRSGDLYISVGGRGTRGAVYRVRPKTPNADAVPLGYHDVKPLAVRDRTIPTPTSLDFRTGGVKRVREWQRAIGDIGNASVMGKVWEGYTPRKPIPNDVRTKLLPPLRAVFPSLDANLDRELSRMFALLTDDDPVTLHRVLATISATSDVFDDVHMLIVAARLTAPRSADDTARTANALLTLDAKYAARKLVLDRNWPTQLGETVSALIQHDPKLVAAIQDHPRYGQPAHGWLVQLPELDRTKSARAILRQAVRESTEEYDWSPALVSVLAALPNDEVRPMVERLWKRGDLNDTLMPLIARAAAPSDREKLHIGLRSFQPRVAKVAAEALTKLEPNDADVLPAIVALRRFAHEKSASATLDAVSQLLQSRTGQLFRTSAEAEVWLRRERPHLAEQLARGSAQWTERAKRIAWDSGSADRGRLVFQKTRCAECHDRAGAVGPALVGVANRFSRDDLLTAIVDPNRDVSARYRPLQLTLLDGRTVTGVVIYEAVDGVIVSNGLENPVRVAPDQIELKRTLETSLMPVGLLDASRDEEIADLMAYLRSLK